MEDVLITSLLLTVFIVIPLFLIGLIIIFFRIDKRQQQHAILRNYPVWGRIRYLAEMVSPKVRQYFISGEEEQPFSRTTYQAVVRAGKYLGNVISFGSKRNVEEDGYYLANVTFPKLTAEMVVDNETSIETVKYKVDKEGFFSRKEHVEDTKEKPWLLSDEDSIIIGGNTARIPFKTKSLIGMAGMSYGGLGERAIEALSHGLGSAKGAWMNTGEGGISPYHLKGDVPIIAQIGPAYFGFRDKDGKFSWDLLKKWGNHDNVVAFELKLGQGAKIRGGHVEGSKVTPEIAEIRGVEPWKTIDSPNRFEDIHSYEELLEFATKIRDVSGKPVGFKLVVGSRKELVELSKAMLDKEMHPDFISIDGGEGGTGATYKSMADSVGLPLKSALLMANSVFRGYNIRDKFKIIASGKLVEADRIAVALSMGADLVQIARGFMIQVGCILAMECANNTCPVGIATTDPKLQKALVVGEKRYRVTNYVLTLRQELFSLAASCGLDSPAKFNEIHVMYKDSSGVVYSLEELRKKYKKQIS